MGVVSPNGIGTAAFWKATREGLSGIGPITRFDASRFSPSAWRARSKASAKKTTSRPRTGRTFRGLRRWRLRPWRKRWTRRGSIRPRCRGTNCARSASSSAQAAAAMSSPRNNTGCITPGKWRQCSVYVVPTSTIGTLASEVSMRFGFRGLSHVISTGCTSSTDALGYACRTIQAGVLDHDGGGRRGRAHRSADSARLHGDAYSGLALERSSRNARRGHFRGTAKAS